MTFLIGRDAVYGRKVIYSLGDVKSAFSAKRLTYTKDPIRVFRAFLVETSGPQRKSPGYELNVLLAAVA